MRCMLLAAILALSVPSGALQADVDQAPSTDLAPERVVQIVIEALRTNAEREGDAGIATVFSFASPGNRSSTGPLPRFTRMIKRGFSDMLTHVSSRYDDMKIEGDIALQSVWLMSPSGAEVGYAFQLGRQQGGEYDGMWMTESVFPLGEGERSGTRI